MALLELSTITGTLAKMGLEKGFKQLNRSEAAIRVRKRLKMPTAPNAGDYEAIYRHTLVEWGVFKPEPVLDFFRDERIYEAFVQAYHKGDPAILGREAAEVVQWAEEYGAFGGLEYDPRRELLAFTATFDEVVDYARTAVEVRQDLALARLEQRLYEVMALLAKLHVGQISVGEIHLSGEFSRAISVHLYQAPTRQIISSWSTSDNPLPIKDRSRIVNLILQADVIPYHPEGRKGFLWMCGLDFLTDFLLLDGSNFEFVTSLVAKAATSRRTPTPGLRALDALLDYVISQESIPPQIQIELEKYRKKDQGEAKAYVAIAEHITPQARYKVHKYLASLGVSEINNYAYYFGISLDEDDEHKVTSDQQARVFLLKVEGMNIFQQLIVFLIQIAPNEFARDITREISVGGDVNKIDELIHIPVIRD